MTRQRITTAPTFLLLTACGIAFLIGQHAGHADRHEFVTPTVTVTAWADRGTPSYDDERWQDPSGLPYCDPASPLYPCLTNNPFSVDGGPEQDWQPVSQEFADALAEGDDTPPENATTRDWQACWAHVTENTYTVVCPDGYVAHA